MKRGILVACDQQQEWLLSWWWESYSRYNAYPVIFVDWGMSEEAKKWCLEHGELTSVLLDPTFTDQTTPLSSNVQHAIEELNVFFLSDIRPFWFSKPAVMRDSPYDVTIWMDLDCEVLSPLEELFSFAEVPAGVAIARDTEVSEERNLELGILGTGETLYNSGVIVFKKNSPLIAEWAELCKERHTEFFGDQNAFSYLVHAKQYDIAELPEIYNWRVSRGLHFSARIIHWVGSWGKAFIKQYGGLKNFIG